MHTTKSTDLHDELMGARDESEIVVVIEDIGYVAAERVPCTARRYAPPTAVVRVTPQQIAHRSLVRHLS